MNDWGRKQFAMRLMVHCGYSIDNAIRVTRDFEQAWGVEDAGDRAFSDVLLAASKGLGDKPNVAQVREIITAARRAGDLARAEAIANLDGRT